MVLVHYAVIAVPERRERAETITSTLAAALYTDDNHRGCEWNHRRALADTPSFADWVVVLEDDAIPCNRFEAHVEQEISAAGENQILQLYSGTSYPRQSQRAYLEAFTLEAPLITTSLNHAVAYALPAQIIPVLLKYTSGETKPWDEQVSDYIKHIRWTVKATYPSHADHADGKSIIPASEWQPRNLPRKAMVMCAATDGSSD